MKEIISTNERVRRIQSPYPNLQYQFDHDSRVMELLWKTKGLMAFNMWELFPKITYDDWFICSYLRDGKLYYITTEDITEVEVKELLECDKDGNVITPYGVMTDDDDIIAYVKDCVCCGQADDLSCYVYFIEKQLDSQQDGNGVCVINVK